MSHGVSLIIGYLLGSILAAKVVSQSVFHQDPRKVGSGNPGSANIGAVYGKKWGIITCLGDFLKTLLCLLIVYRFWPSRLNLALAGLGLILGHCFSFLNHFQGGKGVAVAALFAIIYDCPIGIFTLLIALVLVITMKNLTIPPLIFIILFSGYETLKVPSIGVSLVLMALVMLWQFRFDLVDFVQGEGKRVDILTTLKKKLRS